MSNNKIALLDLLLFRGEELSIIARIYGAKNLRVYGSVARREDNDQSDVDLLVDMDEESDFLDLVRFKKELEDLFGRTINITTVPALQPILAERILKEAVSL
ncbi:MAG TPA: nucleotidyltransferase domain-containing protein [Methanospirillum sp.]|nr:nucleotidyltransferase domain-containing protein [Methanospirillum sp.]